MQARPVSMRIPVRRICPFATGHPDRFVSTAGVVHQALDSENDRLTPVRCRKSRGWVGAVMSRSEKSTGLKNEIERRKGGRTSKRLAWVPHLELMHMDGSEV